VLTWISHQTIMVVVVGGGGGGGSWQRYFGLFGSLWRQTLEALVYKAI